MPTSRLDRPDPQALRTLAIRALPALVVLAVQIIVFPLPAGSWFQGVILGALNALVALGLALIWRSNRILNFAKADMGTFPAALGVGLIVLSGLPYVVGLVVGLAAAVVTGALVQILVIRRFRHSSRLTLTVATIGISQILIVAALLAPRLWGSQVLASGDTTGYSFPWHVTVAVGAQLFHADDFVAAVVAVACLVGLGTLLTRTDTGIALRAAAERPERASLLGIPVARMELVAWIIAAVLSFLGVFLQGAILGFPLNASVGVVTLVTALAAVALGAFDDFGAIVASALSVGVLLQGVRWNHPTDPALGFAVLGVVIAVAMIVRRSQVSRQARGPVSDHLGIVEPRPLPRRLGFTGPTVAGVALIVVAAGLLPSALSTSHQYQAATLLATGVVTLSIWVLTGWAGQVTLGQMGFAAVGAAVGATATVTWDLDIVLGLLVTVVAGACAGLVVGLPALRFRGLLPAATTLAFGLAASGYLFDPSQFTWIPSGDIIARPAFGLWKLDTPLGAYRLSLVVLVLVAVGLVGIRNSQVGRAIRAHRDNDLSSQSYGISLLRARLGAYAISGAVAAVGGFLLVHIAQHFDSATYAPTESLTLFTAAVVGGVGSLAGVLFGAGYLNGSRWFLTGYWQLLPTAVGVLVVLLIFPGGLASLMYRVRDRIARSRARARGITFDAEVGPRRASDVEATPAALDHGRNDPVPSPDRPDTSTAPVALRAEGIRVRFGGATILDGIDLEVRRGEIVALMGTNGAGKSTLLRAICGTVDRQAGTVLLGDRDVTGLAAEKIAGMGLAQMPGGQGVFEGLTVAENLRVAGWLNRTESERSRTLTERQLQRFPQLAARLDEPAANLSGGQQQMLALAMAMMNEPDVLLVDELSLGLSPLALGSLLEVITGLRDEGMTIVLVEQSVGVALGIADRALFMERGTMRFEGAAADLAHRPDLLRSVYLDAPDPQQADPRPRTVHDGATTVSLDEVTVGFGAKKILDEISLSIGRGEILGIIGPNGAGKTTLFDALSGFTPVRSGRIEVSGRDITHHSPARRARAGMGRVFQDSRLFGSLSVYETLQVACDRAHVIPDPASAALFLPIRQLGEAAIHARCTALVDLLGLGWLAHRPISELSTGQRRLVDFGCVLAHEPRVVLLDEPTAGVAQAEAEALMSIIADLRDHLGATVVIIEHDMKLLAGLADRLVALDDGRLVTSGTPDQVLGDPRVISSYLGTVSDPAAQGATSA